MVGETPVAIKRQNSEPFVPTNTIAATVSTAGRKRRA